MSEDTGRRRRPFDLPPLWLGAFLLLGWGLDGVAPLIRFDHPAIAAAGWALIAGAIGLAIWSAIAFARRRTSIIPGDVASALVTAGPYRFSRNPIYLADAAILAGQGLVHGSLWPLLLTPAFMAVLTARFIRPEEDMLRATFPEAFTHWSARVRRWI